jgi:protein-S-isoprenylcysteine O-methyltransferase Ste14
VLEKYHYKKMEKLIIFGILSVVIIIISWRTLFNVKSHGFYRFFSWECLLWLFINNAQYWFYKPFRYPQVYSWFLLIFSAYFVVAGLILMKKFGKPKKVRDQKNLFQFEETSELVDTGIFKHIRHPMYSSLLFLTWAVFLKSPTEALFYVSLFSSVCLYFTAIFDEKDCIKYFGDKYMQYMKRSKMFIPYVI